MCEITEKLNTFRMERLDKIRSGNAHIALKNGYKIVLHLLPEKAFNDNITLNLNQEQLKELPGLGLIPFSVVIIDENHAIQEGCIVYKNSSSGAYTMIFPNGCIESVLSTGADKLSFSIFRTYRLETSNVKHSQLIQDK